MGSFDISSALYENVPFLNRNFGGKL